MFKNAHLFRIAADGPLTPAALEEALSQRPLTSPTGEAIESSGWIPAARHNDVLVQSVGLQAIIRQGTEARVLPTSVINKEVARMVGAYEAQHGYAPGKKQKRDMRDEAFLNLLPRAFIKDSSITAWIDMENGWFVVDTPSASKAESLAENFRASCDHFRFTLPDTDIPLGTAMTDWLMRGEAPGRFELDDECELVALDSAKATVRYLRHTLDQNELRAHIDSGKRVTKLGLTWNDGYPQSRVVRAVLRDLSC